MVLHMKDNWIGNIGLNIKQVKIESIKFDNGKSKNITPYKCRWHSKFQFFPINISYNMS
jgi:hypothetical protein